MKKFKKTDSKRRGRLQRKARVRKKIFGETIRPRLCVFRSHRHIYAQIINDDEGKTLVSASTLEKNFSNRKQSSTIEGAKVIGKLIAERAKTKSIKDVKFDRSGYMYHGRIKALADSAREGGLNF